MIHVPPSPSALLPLSCPRMPSPSPDCSGTSGSQLWLPSRSFILTLFTLCISILPRFLSAATWVEQEDLPGPFVCKFWTARSFPSTSSRHQEPSRFSILDFCLDGLRTHPAPPRSLSPLSSHPPTSLESTLDIDLCLPACLLGPEPEPEPGPASHFFFLRACVFFCARVHYRPFVPTLHERARPVNPDLAGIKRNCINTRTL